jgi:RNA-directed DNA polymerase
MGSVPCVRLLHFAGAQHHSLLANYFRYAVSKAVFSAIDSLAWGRIMRWLRRKYKRGRNRIGMPELRRRFCGKGWRLA